MTTDVFNQAHEKVGTVELPARVFEAKWTPRTVHQVVTVYLANQRNTVAHTKGRGAVSGGGKKPWRQKHTGRARHGSSRSPLWRGGGVTFGPSSERVFARKVSDAMKRAALRSILSRKAKDGELIVVDRLAPETPKTKQLTKFLKNFLGAKPNALLVPAGSNVALRRAERNIPKVETVVANDLHTYACLAHRSLLLEKEAIAKLAKRLG